MPSDIKSSGNQLFIKFETSSLYHGKGFAAYFMKGNKPENPFQDYDLAKKRTKEFFWIKSILKKTIRNTKPDPGPPGKFYVQMN